MVIALNVAGAAPSKRQRVADLRARGAPWSAEEFAVDPELGGEGEGAREVRFVLYAHEGAASDYELYGIYRIPAHALARGRSIARREAERALDRV